MTLQNQIPDNPPAAPDLPPANRHGSVAAPASLRKPSPRLQKAFHIGLTLVLVLALFAWSWRKEQHAPPEPVPITIVTVLETPSAEEPSEFDDLYDDIHSPALMGIGAISGPGGSGHPFGSRIGRGKGRAIRRAGGQGAQGGVDLALEWLAEHQDEDGKWNCVKYDGGSHDAAVTGLAALAFLANGHTPYIGRYQEVVRKAVTWIESIQQPDGHYGPYRYEAAMTLTAMAEAYGMSSWAPDASWQRNIQKAVDAAVAAQGPDGGWRYTPGSEGDMSVSGWWMIALTSAREVELDVPETVFEQARSYWTESAVRIEGAGDLYAGRYRIGHERVTTLSTATLMCGRRFLGFPPEDPITRGAARVLLEEIQGIPDWRGGDNRLPGRRTGEGSGSQDFLAWYYQALGFFQFGVRSEEWRTFSPLIIKELMETQRRDGTLQEYQGSWDPNEGGYERAGQWGRVGQTAVGALILSVFYRYPYISIEGRRR